MNVTTLNNLAVLHIIRFVVITPGERGRLCMCSCTYKDIFEGLSHMNEKGFFSKRKLGRFRQ